MRGIFWLFFSAVVLSSCDGRSIDSATFDRMKSDMSSLRGSCSDSSEPIVINKGQWARITINCEQLGDFVKWKNSVTELVTSQGWVNISDDGNSREFCHSVTGIHLRLSPGENSSAVGGRQNLLSARYPAAGAECAKFRPNPYRPLDEKSLQK